jgi:type II secretory pathway component GspD/PulD (secretin)
MNPLATASLMVLTLGIPVNARADSAAAAAGENPKEPASQHASGVPLSMMLDVIAHKTGKKFIVDSRAHADIEILGEEVSHVTYPELLTILNVYGYTAVETGGFALIIPESSIRTMPLPRLTAKETYPDSQYVTVVIPIGTMPAAMLVPVLRPLIPAYGHLAHIVCDNSLVLIDKYANVRRLQDLIKILDVGKPYIPAKCELPIASP